MPNERPPLAEDERFLLGKIAAVVESLPVRMDKFETKMETYMASVDARLGVVEKTQAQSVGSRRTAYATVAMVAAFVGSLCSGLVAFALGKVH